MSEQDDELELEALQRQLEDAFATVRPRSGFEDDLWLRVQARRPIRQKLRDAWDAVAAGVSEVPAVPATAVAVVLVVAIGVGLLTFSGALGTSKSGGAALSSQGGAKYAAVSRPFGTLPVPTLRTSGARTSGAPNGTNPVVGAAAADAYGGPGGSYYLGPARLTWTGTLGATPAIATVYRYTEPGPAEAGAFAAGLGASPQAGKAGPSILGMYRGSGFTVTLRGSTASPAQEPFFSLVPEPIGPAGADPGAVAAAFLSAHSLVPIWPNSVTLEQPAPPGNGSTRVEYLRGFQINSSGTVANLVDSLGDRYGLEVDVSGGQVAMVAGPIPLSLATADYPVRSPQSVLKAALTASSSSPGDPAVSLTSVELVYALAFSVKEGQGFYEPCFLFTGNFQLNGKTYTKRVLVPAVAS